MGQSFSHVQPKNCDRCGPWERHSHFFIGLLLLLNVNTQPGSYSFFPCRELRSHWGHCFPWSSLLRPQGSGLWCIKDALTWKVCLLFLAALNLEMVPFKPQLLLLYFPLLLPKAWLIMNTWNVFKLNLASGLRRWMPSLGLMAAKVGNKSEMLRNMLSPCRSIGVFFLFFSFMLHCCHCLLAN